MGFSGFVNFDGLVLPGMKHLLRESVLVLSPLLHLHCCCVIVMVGFCSFLYCIVLRDEVLKEIVFLFCGIWVLGLGLPGDSFVTIYSHRHRELGFELGASSPAIYISIHPKVCLC